MYGLDHFQCPIGGFPAHGRDMHLYLGKCNVNEFHLRVSATGYQQAVVWFDISMAKILRVQTGERSENVVANSAADALCVDE